MTTHKPIPPVGTILTNSAGGKVRARMTVVEGGFRYRGKTYPTLSAASTAACTDLGITPQGGWGFWGLLRHDSRRLPAIAAPRALLRVLDELARQVAGARAAVEAAVDSFTSEEDPRELSQQH